MENLFTCSNCQHLNGSQCRLHSMTVTPSCEVCPQHAFTGPDRAAVQQKLCSECPYFEFRGEPLCLAADQSATQAFPLNCYRYRAILSDLEGHTVLKTGAPSVSRAADPGEVVTPEDMPVMQAVRQRRDPSRRFPFLRYINPFTLICLLILLTAVSVFFHIGEWSAAPMPTFIALIVSLPCMALVYGLIWGVMNRPLNTLHLILSLVLAADAAKLAWLRPSPAAQALEQSGISPEALAVTGLWALAVLVVSFVLALLGTAITNAIFRVRRRRA